MAFSSMSAVFLLYQDGLYKIFLEVVKKGTFVNCGHLKKFLLLPDLKIW